MRGCAADSRAGRPLTGPRACPRTTSKRPLTRPAGACGGLGARRGAAALARGPARGFRRCSQRRSFPLAPQRQMIMRGGCARNHQPQKLGPLLRFGLEPCACFASRAFRARSAACSVSAAGMRKFSFSGPRSIRESKSSELRTRKGGFLRSSTAQLNSGNRRPQCERHRVEQAAREVALDSCSTRPIPLEGHAQRWRPAGVSRYALSKSPIGAILNRRGGSGC